MKKLLLIIVFAISIANVFGTAKYWVGGTSGNWASTSSWSLASDGTGAGAAIPVASDDVYFNAASGANVIAYCTGATPILNSLNATNCNVTFAIVPAATLPAAAGTITTGSKTINLTSTIGVAAAQFAYVVSGDGTIPYGTTVASLVAGTSVTLNQFPFVGNPSNPATLVFAPTTATSIVTKTVKLDNANVKAFFAVTVNGGVGNGTSTYDFSFLNSSTWTQCPLASGQSITLGAAANTFFMTGNSPDNYFDGSSNGYITVNSLTNQTLYFNQSTIAGNGGIGGPFIAAPSVAGWGSLSPTKGIMTLANNVATNRFVFGSNGTNLTQGIVLNPNVALTVVGSGSCSFNATSNCQGIDGSASGSKIIVSQSGATFLATTSGNKIFKPSPAVINYLEFYKSGSIFVLPQAINVKNLVLTSGTINNSTNNITLSDDGTITSNVGVLTAALTSYGASPNVIYNNTAADVTTSSFELPSSVNSLTISTATKAVNLNAALTITGALTLTSGTLTNASTNNITFNSGSATPVEITRTAGSIGGTGAQAPVFTSSANITYNNSTSTTIGLEMPTSTSKLNNLTINNAGGVIMSAVDRTVNGTLNLTAGTLAIGVTGTPQTLTYKGNSVTRTSGNINGTITGSGITFANASPITLPSSIFTGNVSNFIVSGAGAVSLQSALSTTTLAINSGAVLNMQANALSAATTISGTGKLQTQSTVTAIPTAKTWPFEVEYNNATGGQSVIAGTYTGGLTMSNTSGVNTAAASLTIGNVLTLNTGSTLLLPNGVAISSGTGFTGSTGAGTLQTADNNAGAYRLPRDLTWDGKVQYTSGGNNRIVPGIYNDLDVDNGIVGTVNWGIGTEAGTIKINGTLYTVSTSYGTTQLSTVEFGGVDQVIPRISAYNFKLSNSGTTTFPATYLYIANTFTPGSTTSASQGSIVFNGTTGAQTIPAFTYNSLNVNNTAGAVLGGSATINATLYFNSGSGVLTTGSHVVTIASGGTVGNVTSTSYVNGNLKKLIAAGANPSKTFEIGDETTYAPVTVAITGTIVGSTGSIQASTTSGDHAQIATSGIDAAKSVNRTWTISNPNALTGLTSYSPTFTFVAGDIDGGATTGNFVVGKYTSSVWSLPTISTKTATTTKATGISTFGTFAIGEVAIITPTFTVTPIGTYTYNGSPQGPIAATTGGSAGAVTFSYEGTNGTSYTASATLPTNAGSYTATATVAANGNYSSASSSATAFTIEKVALTITAANQSVVYGTAAATVTGAGTYTPSGFVNSEGAGVISGSVTYSTTYTNATTAGTTGETISPIVGSLTATNYSFTPANGTITIDAPNTVPVPAATALNLGDLSVNAGTDLTVANTGTLTVNASPKVNSVTVDAGGKLNVASPITVETVTFKAGKDATTFSAKIDADITATTVRLFKTIDDTKWYFMSFPCDVTIAAITKSDGGSLGTLGEGGNWFIKYYDGAQRAESGTTIPNWKHIALAPDPTKLLANHGYIFGLKTVGAPYNVELSIPLSPNVLHAETDGRTAPVTAFTGTAAGNHYGWNLIGLPYISNFNSNGKTTAAHMSFIDGNNITYTDISNADNYTIPPMAAYFVQVLGGTSSISFDKLGRQAAKTVVSTDLSDKVQLNFASATGVDKTNFIMDNNQSTAYEIGMDYEKMIGLGTDKPQVYSMLGGVNYSYNALPMSSVTNLPIGYYTKTAGSTTISVDATQAPSLSSLLLTDYGVSPIKVTDLLMSSYTFTAAAGTNNSRFTITAQRVPTAIETETDVNAPQLSIINGQLLIKNLDGKATVRVFDALGRMVANKTASNNSFEINISSKGIYTVQIEAGAKSWVKKIVYSR
jgi:hypothetical protein